jgi:hypothetical protein
MINNKPGGIAVRGPPPKKMRKIAGKLRKIAVFGKGNFGFHDSGQGKRRQKLQVQTDSKPSRTIIHIFE